MWFLQQNSTALNQTTGLYDVRNEMNKSIKPGGNNRPNFESGSFYRINDPDFLFQQLNGMTRGVEKV